MKDVKDITALVYDRGTFFPVAERLARDVKTCYYHKPRAESFQTFAETVRGDGHPQVKYLSDIWPVKDEVDLWVFPDCADAGLQAELVSQGKAVWGSRGAADYENLRGKWLTFCEENGLPMPRTERIRGLTNLRLFLQENPEQEWFIKISTFRGDMETWGTKSPDATRNKLDLLALKFGPFQDDILFYVQEKLDTDIESGADTYNIRGQWPSKIVLGYEKKGQSYFATWQTRADMPPEVWGVMDKIAPMLAQEQYANFISSEVRIAEGKSYWLDPCLRVPSPAGEEQLELYGNLSEIIWQGANGILVEPEMAAKFCGEAVISYCGDKEGWKSVKVPEDIQRWIKLYACAHKDGSFHFPPSQDPEAIGCAVALGDTAKEVVDNLKGLAEALKDELVELHITEIADLFGEIAEAEDEGIPFGDGKVPEPAEVLK